MAGLAATKTGSIVDRDDPLSNLYKFYRDEIRKIRVVGHFENVFIAWKLALFIASGIGVATIIALF